MRCRLEQLRGQFICIHSAAVAAAAALRVVITACCCFSFCYVDIVRGFTTEYLDLLLIDYNYNVRCCTTYEMYLYTCYVLFLLLLCSALLYCSNAVAAAAAACCCCSSSCAGWQNLFPWFIASNSSVLFLFIPLRIIFNVPLGCTVAFTAPVCT